MNQDFVEILSELSAAGADYIVVGAPLFDLSLDDLTRPDTVFQIGLPPARVDILSGISGVTFEDAWARRPKDLLDLALLEEADRN